jgi:epoxyqueuosine reductase
MVDRAGKDYVPVPLTKEELAGELARLCPTNGIDLAGAVALPCALPHRDRWFAWVAEGRHGDLAYMIRDPAGRADPTLKNPWARSLLVFAQRYSAGWPADDHAPVSGGPPGSADDPPWIHRVARYARGLDYHDVLLNDIKNLLKGLQGHFEDLVAFPATDTGPFLEREFAWLAGLGFLGKNTCLIHEKMGSGLFLGVALTNLAVEGLAKAEPAREPLFAAVPRRRRPPPRAAASHCGSCTRCIEACPTGAISPQGGLDAGSCLSTWTIEWRGNAPSHRREQQGGILFGCDICQAVCPWNRKAAGTGDLGSIRGDYAPLPSHGEFRLADLLDLNEDIFREKFRHSPLWRCHRQGLCANARTVLDNVEP